MTHSFFRLLVDDGGSGGDTPVSRIGGPRIHFPHNPVEPLGGQDAVLLEAFDPKFPDGPPEPDHVGPDPDLLEDLKKYEKMRGLYNVGMGIGFEIFENCSQ